MGQTVEEGCHVDAGALRGAREIPHLAERGALAQSNDDGDQRECKREDDGCVAEIAEYIRDSCEGTHRWKKNDY